MPSNESAAAPAFCVPTVNIAPYLADPSSAEADKIIGQIRQACVSTGFFQIVGHGISKELQQSVFAAAAKFFALPFDEKKKLDAKKTVGHRGYDVLATQSYEPDVLPDLKEGYFIGEDLPDTDPRVQQQRWFMGQNVWPSEQLLARADFRGVIEEYYEQLLALSLKVVDMVGRSLPFGDHVFDNLKSNNPVAPMRLLHYPPAPKREEDAQRQLGASAHTDFGAITLLLQDENAGLEVFDHTDNVWVPVEPNTEAYVVNIADMLSMWTSNRYKSSLHRVINKNPWDRYSVVFFFEGNLDCALDPLDGSGVPEGQEVLTVEGHMLKRMKDSYNQKNKALN